MHEIPFLSLRAANLPIEDELIQAVNRVIKSGWYILGNEVKTFEHMMATDLAGDGKGYVASCNSGTDALILSLKAAGVRADDEVITVSHTAIPTVAAIVAAGAVPVFIDIDPKTWVMDTAEIKNAVSAKTKAIVPVHLYGNMVDIFAIRQTLHDIGRDDISIIEDCAQAHGATLNGQAAGTIGDFGAFSFYPSKNIGALGDGGAVFTANKEHYQKLLMLRNYGQADRYNASMTGGINSRLDEIQAAVLAVKLKHLHEWNAFKSKLMNEYRNALADMPFAFQQVTESCTPAWHLCVIALDENLNRDAIREQFKRNGINTLIHYPHPNHLQAAFKNYSRKSLRVTEALSKRIVSVPFSYNISTEDSTQLLAKIIACFS